MAIAFDSSASATLSGSTITISATIGSNDNRLLLVGMSQNDGGTVTSVIYNSTENLAAVASQTSFSNNNHVDFYFLTAPSTGTANVVITFADSPDSAEAGTISLYGVDQTTSILNTNSATGTSTTPSVDITVTHGNLNSWVVDSVGADGSGAATPGSGQTERYDLSDSKRAFGSTEPFAETSTTPVTMSHTISSVAWGTMGCEVKPSRRHVRVTHDT